MVLTYRFFPFRWRASYLHYDDLYVSVEQFVARHAILEMVEKFRATRTEAAMRNMIKFEAELGGGGGGTKSSGRSAVKELPRNVS